jgi:hypothetical protein
MKTNVLIELDDVQLSALANLIDGKTTKRKATRKDVVSLCQQHIGGLLEQQADESIDIVDKIKHINRPETRDIYRADPEDEVFLDGADPGYVRGWNMVKRGAV